LAVKRQKDSAFAAAEEQGRRAYHHGNLREALIDAALDLIALHGPDGFTMADACRQAGVSTAAPYRHFADRNALLEAVCSRGFEQLGVYTTSAKEGEEKGSVASIVAGGLGYLQFALDHPALFRMMFVHDPDLRPRPVAEETGRACFSNLLMAVSEHFDMTGRGGQDPMPIALKLWALVHGLASLKIDGALKVIAPDAETEALIAAATAAILRNERAQ